MNNRNTVGPKHLGMILLAAVMVIGCAQVDSAQAPESSPFPTIDQALLSATPLPTATPQATFTPFPTIERVPSRTPLATLESIVTLIPLDQTQTATAAPPSASGDPGQPADPSRPRITPTGFIGIPGAGIDAPDLVPILALASDGVLCNDFMLVQLGIQNRGTGPARNFTVEWSLGWGEHVLRTEFIEELQWGDVRPAYILNGEMQFPCEETSTFTAYIRIDINDDVIEIYEDNNYDEQTYTLTFAPSGDY
ncbi:MAG: hypothetical protein GYB68_09555 [Chloroflexi bacterium]|nr:hypothetical protein [Chloroflexota bacterium]